MIRYIRPFSYLLPILILQACVYFQPQKARPYQPQSTHHSDTQQTTSSQVAPSRNPTVHNIQKQASQLRNQGQLEAAAQTLERGLRIAPKNASLWSQLAEIRLQQRHFGQAQSMAQKSSNLARGDSFLIQINQSIILEAQRQQQ